MKLKESDEPVVETPKAIPDTEAEIRDTLSISFDMSETRIRKSACLMSDDETRDIKYARQKSLRKFRRKAALKVKVITSSIRAVGRLRTRQCKRNITWVIFGRSKCPGISKSTIGPGSYNVNYSSFGQTKSFNVQGSTFGSTVRGACKHITRSGHMIYKTKKSATKRAGVRTSPKQRRRKRSHGILERPTSVEAKQKRRKPVEKSAFDRVKSYVEQRRRKTPLRRDIHSSKPSAKRSRKVKVSQRSRTTRSKANLRK
jgi:hypothetical protein